MRTVATIFLVEQNVRDLKEPKKFPKELYFTSWDLIFLGVDQKVAHVKALFKKKKKKDLLGITIQT